jgi:hypothetical protein
MDVNAELARLQQMLAQGQLSPTDFEMYRAQLFASAGYPPVQPGQPQPPGYPPQQPGYPGQPGAPAQAATPGGGMTKWIVIALAVIAVLGFVYKSQQAKQADQPTSPTQAPAGGTGANPGTNPAVAPGPNPGTNPGTAPAGGVDGGGAPAAPSGPVAAGDNPLLGTWAADATPAQCAGSKFMFGQSTVDFIAPATQMQPQHFDGVTYQVKSATDVSFDIPGKGPSEVTLTGGGFMVGPCAFRKQG